MRLSVLVLAGSGALLSLMGCAPKGSAINPITREPAAVPSSNQTKAMPDWFFRAVDLRVHPATRYIREGDALRLEARIELLDQFNEPIKDVGTLRFELGLVDAQGDLVTANGQPRRLRWTVDLLTAEDHRKRWDPVSRCYVVPLNIERADIDFSAGQTQLWVTFRPAWPNAQEIPTTEAGRKPVNIRVDW